MKKTLLIILTCIILCSCSYQDSNGTSQYESQLYASLVTFFDHYYSVDLWSLELVTDKLYSLDIDSSEECMYIQGKIDCLLELGSAYCHFVYSGQNSLNEKIISEDFNKALGEYINNKDKFLKLIEERLETDKRVLADNEFRKSCLELSSLLDELNIDVTGKSRDDMDTYIEKLNNASEIMNSII